MFFRLLTQTVQPNRFHELDALRGVAALMVVLFHLTMGRKEADLGFKLGTTGVDLFFMISGFVISISINSVTKGRDFIINRVSRLYPTYWASVTFTFLLIVAYKSFKGESLPWITYFGNLTMFQYYLKLPNLDEPYWTMIIEMIFYMFILFVFQLRLMKYIISIGLLITLLSLSMNYYWGETTEWIFKVIPLLEFFPLFYAGVIFYHLRLNPRNKNYYSLIALLCLVSQIALFDHAGRSRSFISQSEYAVMLTVFFLLFLLFVNGKLLFLVNRVSLFFGKISFALYLTHQYLLLGHVLPFLINRLQFNFWIASLGICLPVSVCIATIITNYIEVPYSAKLKSWLKSKLI